MTERLLQFIWQFQYFNKQSLTLTNGEPLQVMYAGLFNTNQGPDFLEARIRAGNEIWAGHIEIHIQSSAWQKHAHQNDPNYNNVVLHVVWQDDALPEGSPNIPVLTLQERVPKLLLQQYETWMNQVGFIPCGPGIQTVSELVWLSWKERLLVERLQRKTTHIFLHLKQNNQHWEETAWWLMARNFGARVNAEAFEAVARSLPLTLLTKHSNQLHQLEALLLGQANLLEGRLEDPYAVMLQKEYRFYKKKYGLQPVRQLVHFLRMRPAGFPTIRLAQLAMLLHTSTHLFASVRETTSVETLKAWLSVTANDFWHYHFTLQEAAAYQPKKLGSQMVDTIIINALAPLLFAYGHMHHEGQYKDRALHWLQQLAGEKNTIINGFAELGVTCKTAVDSQSMLELKSSYCNHRRCLDCMVGNALLKRVDQVTV